MIRYIAHKPEKSFLKKLRKQKKCLNNVQKIKLCVDHLLSELNL